MLTQIQFTFVKRSVFAKPTITQLLHQIQFKLTHKTVLSVEHSPSQLLTLLPTPSPLVNQLSISSIQPVMLLVMPFYQFNNHQNNTPNNSNSKLPHQNKNHSQMVYTLSKLSFVKVHVVHHIQTLTLLPTVPPLSPSLVLILHQCLVLVLSLVLPNQPKLVPPLVQVQVLLYFKKILIKINI